MAVIRINITQQIYAVTARPSQHSIILNVDTSDYPIIPEGDWILLTGVWNDDGVWKDDAVWID